MRSDSRPAKGDRHTMTTGWTIRIAPVAIGLLPALTSSAIAVNAIEPNMAV